MNKSIISVAQESKSWPFEEARKILKRLEKSGSNSAVFETGYGASGLPHIGTFGEVARTSMVRHALKVLDKSIETKLICFSDDMDALRKVPDNIPNSEILSENLEKPLSDIPDPYNKFSSFADHNNNLLKEFLDQFGFEYEFASATDYYKNGNFDETLSKILENYEAIINIILPTIGEERKKTYSPFLPICPETGQVLLAKVLDYNTKEKSILYEHPNTQEEKETSILGGKCKLQWKADWAMRWVALDVDYEMAGKDLIESVTLSGKICKAIGGFAPVGFNYELFFDEKGEKISKSKGNGISIDDWLKFASKESLILYMYQNPRRAKKLTFDVIPKAVDEYQSFSEKYPNQEVKDQLSNPVFHIHDGNPIIIESPVTFSLILNLVSASQASSKEVIWGFIKGYFDDISEEASQYIDQLVVFALEYYKDFVLPTKKYRKPEKQEIEYLETLKENLLEMENETDPEKIQTIIYDIGMNSHFESLKDWFSALYEILLGQTQGPRLGSFIILYGVKEVIDLIDKAIEGKL